MINYSHVWKPYFYLEAEQSSGSYLSQATEQLGVETGSSGKHHHSTEAATT